MVRSAAARGQNKQASLPAGVSTESALADVSLSPIVAGTVFGDAEPIGTLLSSELVAKPKSQSTRTVDRHRLDELAVVRV